MTLNQLRYFRVLAKTEHYSKAADALGISQPSLSRAISLLEEELNVLLFTRRGRNVVLTDAGRALLRYVEAGLDTLDAGAAAMRDYRTGAGRVTIGSITPVVNTYLPRMLADFRADAASKATFNIRVDQTERLLSGLKAGLYDMVFCSYKPGERELLFTPVVELPFVVAMRKDDPLASCTELTPGQSTREGYLPLDAFADEVMALFAQEPAPAEVLVKRVRSFRHAEAEGHFDTLLAQLNPR